MITQLFKRVTNLFWLLPSFLLWAAFPPMGEQADCLFALAPLLWVSRRTDVKLSTRRWFINGFLFWFATLSWMPAIVKNGGPWPLVVLGWGALSAYCALYFGAFGYLSATYWQWARERNYWFRLFGLIIVEPFLWAGLEIVRSRFLGGFAWNQLGVAPINAGFGVPAALGGVYLISAFVILINGTFASVFERMMPHLGMYGGALLPRALRSIETFLPIILVIIGYQGSFKLVGDLASLGDDSSKYLKVGMIQRNFPCRFKQGEDNPLSIYSNLVSRVSSLNPELIVLSESAMSEFGAVDGRYAKYFVSRIQADTSAQVLVGGNRIADNKIFNSAALYDKERLELYDKVHLVPFGEFIPGDKWLPILQKLAPVGSCTPGKLKLLTLRDGLKLGVAICFEDTDSAQMRELAKMGADVLVFITNDSWFAFSEETVQHAWQARARAIETGLPIVRVGNSGVTGTIMPNGSAAWLVGTNGRPLVDARGTMFDRVKISPKGKTTPYVLLGDSPIFVMFSLLIVGIIVIKYKASYEK